MVPSPLGPDVFAVLRSISNGGGKGGECPTRVKPLPVSIWENHIFRMYLLGCYAWISTYGGAFSRQSRVTSSEMKYLAIGRLPTWKIYKQNTFSGLNNVILKIYDFRTDTEIYKIFIPVKLNLQPQKCNIQQWIALEDVTCDENLQRCDPPLQFEKFGSIYIIDIM